MLASTGFLEYLPGLLTNDYTMMGSKNLLPVDASPGHFLWALAFMCVYPKNDHALPLLLGKRDPKTLYKYI